MFRAKKIALAVAMAAATMSMAQATEVEVFGRFCQATTGRTHKST